MYRPGKSLRNQIDFSYAGYHRRGTTTLSQGISIGNTTYPVGATVESVFNFDIIRGTYSYALLQDERMRIALGLGVFAVPLHYSLKGETTGGRAVVEGADTTLPLPALALRGQFQLIPKLFLNASIEAMYLEISDFKGSCWRWTSGWNTGPGNTSGSDSATTACRSTSREKAANRAIPVSILSGASASATAV